MSLDLDSRQRAILQEMGVRVWWPQGPAPLPVIAVQGAPVQATTAAPPGQSPVAALLTQQPGIVPAAPAGAISGMDWPTLTLTVQQCQACKQGAGRRSPVFAPTGMPRLADWLVVGDPPDDSEERLGTPVAGQAGQLLDNMLKAVGVVRRDVDGGAAGKAGAAYVTNVVKCRPAAARNPDLQDLARCEDYLRREMALVQPKVILALGRFAAQVLLQGSVPDVASIPLGKLRGQVYRYQGIAVIVSYHPAYLLRTPQDKARAWLDLCLALQLVAQHET